MLLSHMELLELIEAGVINACPSQVNATSIDITLDSILMREMPIIGGGLPKPVDLMNGDSLPMQCFQMHRYGGEACYDLAPGEFILGSSREIFNLPNDISAEYMLKSSLARSGLEHLAAGWCDAGWNNSTLTLELMNFSKHRWLRLRPGMKIGQVKFFRHNEVPEYASYSAKGQYNGDVGVTPTKRLR